ncbi:probable ATP-dependent RNA helicase DDX28 [Ixodes scapularis]|uniref:probable ATP-dependent RNA helicase DDX28 n=1 Tax=Ixodes scapularis TaxID=6945 RepID=UPI001A9E47D6|nr:probable ATP-dependent RNA helicase DDX28 [Ixodes scapularis]
MLSRSSRTLLLLWKGFSNQRHDLFVKHVHQLSREDVPTITTPVYLQHKLKKLRKKLEAKDLEEIRRKTKQGNKQHPLITCKRPEFNCYLGHVLNKHDEVKLASAGWHHRKSAGDHFTIHKITANPSILIPKEEVYEDEENSFEAHGVHPAVLRGLQEMGIRQPTLIQREAIPAILRKNNILCSAETGSGKTLAYLVPILTALLGRRDGATGGVSEKTGAPEVVILAPGRELVNQIGDVAQRLCSHGNIRVDILSGRRAVKLGSERLEVVVSTPGLLASLVRRGKMDLSLVRQVVVDEADTLLDDSFSDTVTEILQDAQVQDLRQDNFQVGAQLILVGATLPTEITDSLSGLVDEETLVNVTTPQLHRLLPHVQHKFLRLRSSSKAGALIETVKTDANAGRPVMVFSNAAPSCKWVAHFLAENNISVTSLHGDLLLKDRRESYNRFSSGEATVLACTDLGSRGLDTTHVEHVVNFDFPHHMSDYIHRCGRVGRVGSTVDTCRVTNFVVTPPQVDLVQKIERAARQTKALPRVDANIARFLDERNQAKELEELGRREPGTLREDGPEEEEPAKDA